MAKDAPYSTKDVNSTMNADMALSVKRKAPVDMNTKKMIMFQKKKQKKMVIKRLHADMARHVEESTAV